MEIYNPEYDFFPCINILGIGATGANALNYFGEVGNDFFPERLIVSDKDADLQAKISDFIIDKTIWLFVIADIENLELAKKVAECIEETKKLPTASSFDEFKLPLVTFLILCPSAEDARLANIPDSFGTWIILPEDKIAETGLTTDEVMYQVIDKIACIQSENYLIGLDFADVIARLGNCGRACVGFAEQRLDAENNSLAAVKKALQSPLFIEDIRQAKKCLLVFVGNLESFSMLEANEASTFLDELRQPEDIWDVTLLQVVHDDAANYSAMAFVLATNFEK